MMQIDFRNNKGFGGIEEFCVFLLGECLWTKMISLKSITYKKHPFLEWQDVLLGKRWKEHKVLRIS